MDLVARHRTLSSRKQRINRWYRKPPFAAAMLVLLFIGSFDVFLPHSLHGNRNLA